MTDNQVLALMATVLAAGERGLPKGAAAQDAVSIGAFFGVRASEETEERLSKFGSLKFG